MYEWETHNPQSFVYMLIKDFRTAYFTAFLASR